MIESLKHKLNLYDIDDMYYEEFRDVLTDNAILEDKLLPEGHCKKFGPGDCTLEAISHNEVQNYDKDNEFLQIRANQYNLSVDDLRFTHSKYYLNTQSEEKIQIDIIWETKDKDHALDYEIFGVYFENKLPKQLGVYVGDKDDLDDTPNYRPDKSPYWEEWLVDFGINEDPYPQD